MKRLKFKTNINCTGCLSKVKPVLDAETQIEKWEVDLQSDDRILTIEAENISSEEVSQAVARVGFNAEQISE
jgi:copper chaperone